MSDRLTRKEIKQKDRFLLYVEEALAWVEDNRNLLIAAAVALVLVVVAIVGWRTWSAHVESQGQEALANALEIHGAAIATAEDDGTQNTDGPTYASEAERRQAAREAFEGVREDFGGSAAADVATAYLGDLAAAEGNLERARELWTEVADDLEGTVLGSGVRLNLLALERQSGQAEQALAEVEGMVESGEGPLPPDVALWEMGVLQEELGRDDEAQATFQRLIEEYPDSPWASQARSRVGADVFNLQQGGQLPPGLG